MGGGQRPSLSLWGKLGDVADRTMTDAGAFNRRTFLASIAASGGALMLGFDLQHDSAHAAVATEITAWIVIAPDDQVTIRIAKSEMGQGVFTGLAMLVAEELACDWSKVRAELVAPHDNLARGRVYGDMSTGGSRSIRNSEAMLREAGATAREMLIAAAAARWRVASAECRAQAGVVTHTASGRSVRSMNGCCSSSSSRFRACIVPSCVNRA